MKSKSSLLFSPVAAFALALAACGVSHAQEKYPEVDRNHTWTEDTISHFATLPMLEMGRIKPLSTYAGFKMLKLHGKRTMRVQVDGEVVKLSPVEWLLDCLFYPELAKTYPSFAVLDGEAITAIGGEAHEERGGERYSYLELEPIRGRLFEAAQRYADIEEEDRTSLQSIVLNLAHNVHEFELLIHYLDFARHDFSVQSGEVLAAALPDKEPLMLTDVLKAFPNIQEAIVKTREIAETGDESAHAAETRAFESLYGNLDFFNRTSVGIAIFPPAELENEEYYSPGTLILKAFDSQGRLPETEMKQLAALEALPGKLDDPQAFEAAAVELHNVVTSAASARGDYARVPLENTFYKLKLFYYSLVLFVFSFLLITISWMFPGSKILRITTPVAVAVPLVLLIAGISLRCIIQGRPPVTTLYETLLFITAVIVLVALIIEFMNRQRIALAVASFCGALGMFLSYRYEQKDGLDTMPSLQAVLDTNFWLSTHVTTVTMGYAAGGLAAAIAHIYIFGKLFGIKKGDSSFYRSITRMTYGVVCFGMIFSIVGTILGGVWANYSWGRFWGWDPKENGALLIVLWNLIILHSRMGGYAKDLGLAMMAVFGGMVVAFSHWGVNLLGVGLHSYGFISGIFNLLMGFWIAETVVIALGGVVWLRERITVSDKTVTTPAKTAKNV